MFSGEGLSIPHRLEKTIYLRPTLEPGGKNVGAYGHGTKILILT